MKPGFSIAMGAVVLVLAGCGKFSSFPADSFPAGELGTSNARPELNASDTVPAETVTNDPQTLEWLPPQIRTPMNLSPGE